MADISRVRTVAASPQAVWDRLADFGAISDWAPGVDHSCLLEHGPGLPGTSRRVQVGRTTVVERIIEAVPPRSLSYRIEGLPQRLGRVVNRWTLRPDGAGTEVALTSTVEMGRNPLAWLAERALCRAMARQSDTMLAGLAETFEES